MNLHVPVLFQRKLFLLLVAGFIVSTVVGTVSHECGHYLAGIFLGYRGQHISYKYTTMGSSPKNKEMLAIYQKHQAEITGNKPYPQQQVFESLVQKNGADLFLFLLGGPMETMLAGSAGLLLLYISRKRIKVETLSFGQWVLVFLALFWLRELFNFVYDLGLSLMGKNKNTGDEFRIAQYLHWNGWLLSAALALAGAMVLAVVVFKFVPLKQRFTFMAAGLTGGLAGALLWFVLLGPRVMP